MKKLTVIIAVMSALLSCNKETHTPKVQTNRLEAGITFGEVYVDELFSQGVDSISVLVDGQDVRKFKTYSEECYTKTYIFMLESEHETEQRNYTIKADGEVTATGVVKFSAPALMEKVIY